MTWHDQHIATIIRADFQPTETTFVTPDCYYQQAGFVESRTNPSLPVRPAVNRQKLSGKT